MTSTAAIFTVLLLALASLAQSQESTETTVTVRQDEQPCSPNATFSQDCNTCTCNEDGTAAVCTNNTCPSRSARAVSCTPGTTYKEECNTCICQQDGKTGACTRKACPPGSY